MSQPWGRNGVPWAALSVVARLREQLRWNNGATCTVGADPSGWEHDGFILQQAGRQEEMGRVDPCPEYEGNRETGGIKCKKGRQCENFPLQRKQWGRWLEEAANSENLDKCF